MSQVKHSPRNWDSNPLTRVREDVVLKRAEQGRGRAEARLPSASLARFVLIQFWSATTSKGCSGQVVPE